MTKDTIFKKIKLFHSSYCFLKIRKKTDFSHLKQFFKNLPFGSSQFTCSTSHMFQIEKITNVMLSTIP